MGSPASSSTGGSSKAYIPTAQPQADQSFQNLVQPFIDQGGAGSSYIGSQTGGLGPAAFNYPLAQQFVGNYLTDSTPASTGALSGAYGVADYGLNSLFPMGQQNTAAYSQAANAGLPYTSQALGQAFDPTYTSAISQLQNNPYYAQAQGGAQSAAQFGAGGASVLQNGAGSVFGLGTNPMYQQLSQFAETNPFYAGAQTGANTAAQLGGQGAQALQGAGNSLLQQGFDPQAALFGRTQQQLLDQSNAANASAGLGSSPYGASVTSNALGNFDINWQNNQLQRQATASNAASPLFQAAPGLAASSAAAPSQAYTNQLGTIGSALNQQLGAGIAGLNAASPAYQAAPGLAASSAAAPGQTFSNQIGQVLQALQTRNQGADQGIAGYGSLLGSAGGGLTGAQGLGGTTAGQLGSTSAAPYQTGTGFANNALSGLGGLTNLGNNAYALPQQGLNDLQSYLGLGQSAVGLGGQLGQLGFNQLSQGLGGAIGAANLLGGGGSSGLGGLLGGGAGSGLSGAGIEGLTDFGGGGAALGIPDAIGGAASSGGGLGALLPALAVS